MKPALSLILVVAGALNAFGQGEFVFNNDPVSTGPWAFRVGSPSAPGQGSIGAYLGSDYTASLFYLQGSGYTSESFDNGNPLLFASADTHFFGQTGFSGVGSVMNAFTGAGFFNGGVVVLPLPTLTTITVEVRAWYNLGATSYEDALAKGFNVGESVPIPVLLTTRPTVPQDLDLMPNGIPDVYVQSVPEPTAVLLFSLGAFMLLAFRCLNRD